MYKKIILIFIILYISTVNVYASSGAVITEANISFHAGEFNMNPQDVAAGSTVVLNAMVRNDGTYKNVTKIDLNNCILLSDSKTIYSDPAFIWELEVPAEYKNKISVAYDKNGKRCDNYFYVYLEPNEELKFNIKISIPKTLESKYKNADLIINGMYSASQTDLDALIYFTGFLSSNFSYFGTTSDFKILPKNIVINGRWFNADEITKTISFKVGVPYTPKSTETKIQLSTGKSYNIVFSSEDVLKFSDYVFTVKYDKNKLSVIDFAAQTKLLDTSIGNIQGTDIQIMSHVDGVVKFKILKTIPTSKNYSGPITIMQFKAIANGETTIVVEK